MALLDAGVPVRGLAHITGDGLLNLLRVAPSDIGFVIDTLPEPPPVFGLIAQRGRIGGAEMFQTFNMGVGFCVVVPEPAADRALRAIEAEGGVAWRIGHAVRDPMRCLALPKVGLVGSGKTFETA